jgi:tetratricopeptide (TPR) repeat protein
VDQFLGELAQVIRDEPRLHLLLFLREAVLDEFSHALHGGAPYRVAPLSFESALDAVRCPVEAAGRSFDPGAAEELVRDLLTSRIGSTDGSERYVAAEQVQPALLQVVCSRLWDSLPAETKVITVRDVRRYGDADTTLSGLCGRVIAAVADDHGLPPARLRSWLTRTFLTEFGTPGTAYEGMTHTAGMPNAVARALEDKHLLCAEQRSGSRWYELLSERLVWPLRHAEEEPPPPITPTGYLRAAEHALTLGEVDVAQHFAEEILRTAAAGDMRLRAEATSLLGNLAYRSGKPADAEKCYRAAASLFEAVRDTGAVARQLAAVGQTLLDQGRLAEAVDELTAAVDRLPNDAVVQTELGWALWQIGQDSAAVAVFTGVLGLDGANVEALRGRGEILANLGDARNALRDLDRVMSRAQPSAQAARGLALAELGESEKASEEIRAAVEDAPRNGPVLLYAARAETLVGDQAEAAELARRAIDAADPPLPEHLLEAARRLAGRSQGDGSPPMKADASR